MVKHSSFMVGVPESYLADLGRVIVAWAHVEEWFNVWLILPIAVRMREKSAGSVVTDPDVRKIMGSRFSSRINLFRKHVNELDLAEEQKMRVEKILDQLLKYRKERDEIAHALWSALFKDGQIAQNEAVFISKSWKSSKEYESKRVTQARLKEFCEQIEALYWAINNLILDGSLAPGVGSVHHWRNINR